VQNGEKLGTNINLQWSQWI